MRALSRTARPLQAMMVALVCTAAAQSSLPGTSWAAEPATAQGRSDGHRPKRMYNGPGLKAFVDAYRSWELRDWPATVEGMQTALAADGDDPVAQVWLTSTWIVAYIPSYYLNLALCKLGRCEEALSEHQKVLNLIRDERNDVRKRYEGDCHRDCRMGGGAPP